METVNSMYVKVSSKGYQLTNLYQASIFAGALDFRKNIAAQFLLHCNERFEHLPNFSTSLAKAYGIDETVDDDKALVAILNFGHDIAFYAPAVAIAKGWDGPAYLYHFNEPNPWKGRWKGRATHLTDLAFLWHNYDQFLTDDQRQVGSQFSADWISFGNGKAPWPAFRESDTLLRTYGPSGEGSSCGVSPLLSSSAGRRTLIFDLIEEAGADALLEAFMGFLAKN